MKRKFKISTSTVALVVMVAAVLGLLAYRLAWGGTVVPTVTVAVDVAERRIDGAMFNLVDPPPGGTVNFRFDVADPLCNGRGAGEDRYIYDGQIEEHYADGGVGLERSAFIADGCPEGVQHVVRLRVWSVDGALADGVASFCLGECGAAEAQTETETEAAPRQQEAQADPLATASAAETEESLSQEGTKDAAAQTAKAGESPAAAGEPAEGTKGSPSQTARAVEAVGCGCVTVIVVGADADVVALIEELTAGCRAGTDGE